MSSEFSGPKRSNILEQWKHLAHKGSSPPDVYRTTKNSSYFIKRMTVKEVVSGHSGCVNTVHWNKSGTILLSGSDDRHLNLYSYPSFRMVERIKSGHRANIFNAKFFPYSNDTKICSCSGDGVLHYNNLTDKRNYGKNPFKCHVGIVYDVLTHTQDPNGFLSCGEDGTVRYFDLRTTSSCNCSHCNRHTIIDIKQPVTACTVNPFNPNEIVLGCDDATIRAYDRRFRYTQESKKITQVGRPQSNSYPPIDPAATGLIYAYRPSQETLDNHNTNPTNNTNSSTAHYSNRLTSVVFNWRGDELLASYNPSLLTLISTKPKLNPTVAESNSARSNLFDEAFLFPGGITPASAKPPKILLPYVETHEEHSARTNEDEDEDVTPNNQDSATTETVNDTTTETVNDTTAETVNDTTAELANGTITETLNRSNNSNDVSADHDSVIDTSATPPDILSPLTSTDNVYTPMNDNEPHPADSFHIYDVESSHESDTHEYYDHSNNSNQGNNTEVDSHDYSSPHDERHFSMDATAHNISSDLSGATPNIQRANNDSNLDILTDFTNTNSMNVSYPTSTTDSENHSLQNIPLRRTRSITSAELYASYNQNDRRETNTYSELANVTTATHLPHHIGSAPSMESQSFTAGSHERGAKKLHNDKPRSRYSAWDCASSTFSKTFITDSTARGPNLTNNNQSEMDYNPTFFNSVDSLSTTGNQDRIRAYIDNLFVPSYAINYRGHHNSRTMIKECNFYGDDYVMSGSDDGNVFIWDKWTCELVNIFNADNNVVNCLQPHPIDPLIACSGIDSSIKIAAPISKTAVSIRDINTIIAKNERDLRGANSYYFDATPTMIFHVLLALERIQRNRGDESTNTNDPANIEPLQEADMIRATREGFRRDRRIRTQVSTTTNYPGSTPDNNQNFIDNRYRPNSSPDVDLDSFYESDVYDDYDDEYSLDSSPPSSNSQSSYSCNED